MAAVTIYVGALTPAEVDALKELIQKTGASEGEVPVVKAISDKMAEADDAVVVLLGTELTCKTPGLEAQLINAHASAQRAVLVWPKDLAPVEIPAAVKKYLYSIVPWSVKKLAAVLAGDDVTYFETPSGTSIPKVKTPRNVCVDDEDEEKPT